MTFEEFLKQGELFKIECNICGKPPTYDDADGSFYCEACVKKDYEGSKE